MNAPDLSSLKCPACDHEGTMRLLMTSLDQSEGGPLRHEWGYGCAHCGKSFWLILRDEIVDEDTTIMLCDLVCEDPEVPKKHAHIWITPGGNPGSQINEDE